ncbi:MAG: TIGR03899 family protein [Colwellia sp.]
MGTEKTVSVISNDNRNKNKVITVTASQNAEQNVEQNAKEFPAHKQLFKITQQFGLEGALLPIEKQMPIEDRSNKRARLSSLRKQHNIEVIMEKTYGFCTNKSIHKRTDLDWFDQFINLAEGVSNNTMQDLWAKILAGELARPGSYSLKALKVFRDMSIVDAKLLAKACSLAVKDQNKKNMRLISGSYQQPGLLNFFNKERQQYVNLSQFGLNYADLLSLADNHLIFIQENESNMITNGEPINFSYNGLPLSLTSNKTNVSLQFYKLTAIGVELASLITDKVNDDFFAHLKQQLNHHFIVN